MADDQERGPGKVEMVKISDLKPGPIRHADLPPELLSRIREVHTVVGPFLDTTLEQFEIGFMRDSNPESEVAIWEVIATALFKYNEEYRAGASISFDDGRELVRRFLLISMGVQDPDQLELPAEKVNELLTCWRSLFEDR